MRLQSQTQAYHSMQGRYISANDQVEKLRGELAQAAAALTNRVVCPWNANSSNNYTIQDWRMLKHLVGHNLHLLMHSCARIKAMAQSLSHHIPLTKQHFLFSLSPTHTLRH